MHVVARAVDRGEFADVAYACPKRGKPSKWVANQRIDMVQISKEEQHWIISARLPSVAAWGLPSPEAGGSLNGRRPGQRARIGPARRQTGP